MDGKTSPLFNDTTLSYGAPVILGFAGPGYDVGATSGNETLLIQGRNFGSAALVPRPVVRAVTAAPINGSPLEFRPIDCRIAADHVLVTCVTTSGVGALHWTVDIGGLVSSFPVTGYLPPVLSSLVVVSGNGTGSVVGVDGLVQLGTRGGDKLVFTGDYFGPERISGSVTAVSTTQANGVQLTASSCAVTVPHTEVTCLAPPGAGTGLQWQLVVAGQTSMLSQVYTSYALPRVTAVVVKTATSGPYSVRVNEGTVALSSRCVFACAFGLVMFACLFLFGSDFVCLADWCLPCACRLLHGN